MLKPAVLIVSYAQDLVVQLTDRLECSVIRVESVPDALRITIEWKILVIDCRRGVGEHERYVADGAFVRPRRRVLMIWSAPLCARETLELWRGPERLILHCLDTISVAHAVGTLLSDGDPACAAFVVLSEVSPTLKPYASSLFGELLSIGVDRIRVKSLCGRLGVNRSTLERRLMLEGSPPPVHSHCLRAS
jgi:hypothetical protein